MSGIDNYIKDLVVSTYENSRRKNMATVLHDSDCAQHNEPAYPNGPCDCGADKLVSLKDVLELIKPGEAPCDCEKCDCKNYDDAARMGAWRENKLIYDQVASLAPHSSR